MNKSALIFDLDGTVLDNELQWGKAFNHVLKELGAKIDNKYPHISGIGVKENWPHLLADHRIKTDLSLEELDSKTRSAYKNYDHEVTMQEGFEDFVNLARNMGYLTALATSNIWIMVEDIFDRYNLDRYFDVVTTGEEVEHKKPDPSIFLLTAQKIGVDPKECVVFEDAFSGVEAARSANMAVVVVARDEEFKKEMKKLANIIVISNFSEINLDDLGYEKN